MSKMTKCKTCGEEIATSAKTCPKCGAKNKKPFYTKWWFWVIVLLILAGAIGGGTSSNKSTVSGEMGANATSNNQANTDNATAATEEKKQDLELVGEVTDESDEFATYLSGVIKNNTNKDYGYVQVTFNLYDADDNLIGTAVDNINNLKAGGTWKFKAMGMGESGTPARYELSEITGF